MKKSLISICAGVAILAGCSGQNPSPTPAATTPAPVASPSATAAAQPTPSASPEVTQDTKFLIVPGKSMGEINKDSTEEQLKKAYGSENVKSESIYVGDGMEWPGLAVFPDSQEKRIEVVFQEDKPGAITMLKVSGEKSDWATADGVTLGTDLATLQKLNGKPFKLMGLEWDFGGGVIDWNGGALDGLNIRVGMSGEDGGLTDDETAAIMGEQEVMSDHPAMVKANPRIFQITVNYPMQ